MPRYITLFALLVAAALSSTAAGAGTYRWVDANGGIHYSDQPPPQSTPGPDTPTPAGRPAAKSKVSGAPPAAGRGAPANCGQNFDCLIRHAGSCTPARMARTDDVDFLGMISGKTTTQYEVVGGQATACRFTQRTLDVRAKLSQDSRAKLRADGQTDAQINEMERTWFEKLRAEGQDRMTCDLPVKRLVEILSTVSQGGINASSQDNCRYGE